MHGTIVQNPYEYGYQSVRVLTGLSRGQTLSELEIPEDKFLNIPAAQLRRDNVQEFWTKKKSLLGEQ